MPGGVRLPNQQEKGSLRTMAGEQFQYSFGLVLNPRGQPGPITISGRLLDLRRVEIFFNVDGQRILHYDLALL